MQGLLVDNLTDSIDLLCPPSVAESSDVPPAPASLPRRTSRVAAAEKMAGINAASEATCESVDHLIIVVHGAGTSKETAEEHCNQLQVSEV